MSDLLGSSLSYWDDKCQTYLVLVSATGVIMPDLLGLVSVNGMINVRLFWY